MLLNLLRVLPRGEPAGFSVVSIIREAELRADEDDLPVQHEHAAVVSNPRVDDRHPDVTQDGISRVVAQQIRETLPRVFDGVDLEEVVLAPVPGNFQLRADAVARSCFLRLEDRSLHARDVPFKIERPLVQGTRRETCDSHRGRVSTNDARVARIGQKSSSTILAVGQGRGKSLELNLDRPALYEAPTRWQDGGEAKSRRLGSVRV